MTAAKYSAPPSSTLVTTVLVPRTSPSRNPRTVTSSVCFRSTKPTPRVRLPPKTFTSDPSSSKGSKGGRSEGAVLPSGGVEACYCGVTRRRTTAKATSPEATSASAAGRASPVPPVSGR
jgi:hypothetical protein